MNFNKDIKANNINSNPFLIINRTQKDENKEKIIKESINFDTFNPFSQNIENKSNNFFKNLEFSNPSNKEQESDNSQKKFINNEGNNIYTPEQNINLESKNEKKPFILDNSNNNIHSKIIAENKNKEINENNILFNNVIENKSFNEINDDSKSQNDLYNNKIFVPFKQINNTNNINIYRDNSQNNILSIYEKDNNTLNLDNLNKIIEAKNTEFNPNNNEIISSAINPNLGIIKEEQNESDKEAVVLDNKNLNLKKNELNQNINSSKANNNDLLSINNLLNSTLNEKQLQNIIKENTENIDSLLITINNNIINDVIDLDINKFKIEIDKFIIFAKNKIEKLKLLDDIQNKIKEKLIFYYELNTKMLEIKINEYEKLVEYEEKLDYIIVVQNQIIEELEDINKQLKNNLKGSNPIGEAKINEEELIKNINNTEANLNELNILINNNLLNENNEINDEDIKKMDEIGINDEKSLFFDVFEKIYEPIKLINKEYQQLILITSNIKNGDI